MGGGGGSSFDDPAYTSFIVHTQGYQSGDGQIIFTYGTLAGGAIVGPPTLCMGDTANYTNPTGSPGGTWTSSNGAVATIGSTGFLTSTGTGVTVITYAIVTPCGSYSATKNVTVNAMPAPITGSLLTCTGTSTTLSDTVAGGTWSSANGAIGSIVASTGVYTGVSVGSVVMSYTMPSGCNVTTTVSIVGISGLNHVCAGDSITLVSTAGTGGIWTSGDVTVATTGSLSGRVFGISMGYTLITYSLSSSCIATWPVSVNPLAPIVGRDSVCVGSFRYLSDIVGGGSWSSSVPAIATVSAPFDSGKIYGVTAGITTIDYSFPSGCHTTVPFTVIIPEQ